MSYQDTTIEPDVESALLDLVAIERDRLLGYEQYGLHTDPTLALVDALRALAVEGNTHPVDMVCQDDADKLGIDLNELSRLYDEHADDTESVWVVARTTYNDGRPHTMPVGVYRDEASATEAADEINDDPFVNAMVHPLDLRD